MNQAGGEGHLRPRRKLCGGTSDTAIVAAMCVCYPTALVQEEKFTMGFINGFDEDSVLASLQASPESHTNI